MRFDWDFLFGYIKNLFKDNKKFKISSDIYNQGDKKSSYTLYFEVENGEQYSAFKLFIERFLISSSKED